MISASFSISELRWIRLRKCGKLGCLAALTGTLTIVTLVSREWIELVFRVDPDDGSGALEWLLVSVLAAAWLLVGLLAWNERRKPPRPAARALADPPS